MKHDGNLYQQALQQFEEAARREHAKEGDERGEKQLQEYLKSRESAQSARDSAVDLQNDASKKYSTKKFRGKEIISEKWISNIMGNIGNAISVGDFMGKGAPESVSMAWFCVKIGLNAVKSNYDLYSLYGSGLTAVTEIMILVPHYDELFHDQQRTGSTPTEMDMMLFRDIVAMYAAVLDFCFTIKRHLEASRLKQLGHALQDAFGARVVKFQGKQNTLITLKAKVLEAGDGVFKGRVSGQLTDVQLSLEKNLGQIRDFAGVANELAESQGEILKELQEMKANFKPKTRWDVLKQEFERHKKVLDPIPDDPGRLQRLLKLRHPGTTLWFLGSSQYTAWQSDTRSSLLCLTGQNGSGKSVAIASAFDHCTGAIEEDITITCYFGLTAGDMSQSGLGSDPLNKIKSSIIFQIYQHAVQDENEADILEQCNKLFDPPKKAQQTQTGQQRDSAKKSSEEAVVNFAETVSKLAAILRRNVIITIDGIEQLSSQDQDVLYRDFLSITDVEEQGSGTSQYIKVLASCRSNQSFSSAASTKGQTVDMQEGNDGDMMATLASALSQMSDWSSSEREEATKKVMKMAGPRFDYITGIAIPFLQQPFQRPLSRRLEALPEGITDSYKQALRGMQSNYASLLRVALVWTLYAAQPVRVKEVMEAFSGIYESESRQGDADSGFVGSAGYRANELELQQIRHASGPFLKLWQNQAAEDIVTPADLDQIREFCNGPPESETHSQAVGTSQAVCSQCKVDLATTETLTLTAKQVHLQLALNLLRNLNSPLFQRRFGLVEEEPEDETGVGDSEEQAGDNLDTKTDVEDDEEPAPAGSEANSDLETNDTDATTQRSDTVEEHDHTDEALQSNEEEAGEAEGTNLVEDAEANDSNSASPSGDDTVDSGYVSDDSLEDEDNGEDIVRNAKATNEASSDETVYDGSNDLRYELEKWFYHVREADLLWTAEEKADNADWKSLIVELDKFAIDNEDVFRSWQDRYALVYESPFFRKGINALNVATYFGLTYWAKHLIESRGFDPNTFSAGVNSLQAVAYRAESRDTLKFLLDQPGADANCVGNDDDGEPSALHMWLMEEASAETCKIFVDANVDFRAVSPATKSNGLHFLARVASDPAALDVVLNQDLSTRPDMNATNDFSNTPLHDLLSRSDVPIDLVRAFIKAGANVNKENDYSLRPVQAACGWAEPEVVEALLESQIEDINDPDKVGDTALHDAARVGSSKCVELLVSSSADINRKNNSNKTPLHLAAWNGQADACETLIRLGADLNALDVHGRTPFWFACYSKSEDTALALLNAMRPGYAITKINSPSKRLRTPLRLAVTHGFSKVLQELIDLMEAAEVDIKTILDIQDTKWGSTALHRAAWRGETDCVRVLLKYGANGTLEDFNRKTPLQLANEQWQSFGDGPFEDIVHCLADADVKTVKSDLDLAATAASNGSVRVLDKLYQLGADLSTADSYGWTPITLARRLGKSEAERFLKHQTAWGGTLPSRWIKHAAAGELIDVSEDGLEIIHTSDERLCLTTDKPLPAGLDRFYYEMTLSACEDVEEQLDNPIFGIGFCTIGAPAYTFPGWEPKRSAPSGKSWAYHGDDGGLFANHGSNTIDQDEPYGPGDTVGCGVDLESGRIWFTRNGQRLQCEHTNVTGRLFPIVGLKDAVSVRTNFGGKIDFAWEDGNEKDIEQSDKKTNDVEDA